MGSERSSDGRSRSVEGPRSVTVEVEGFLPEAPSQTLSASADEPAGRPSRIRLLALIGLIVVAALLAVVIGASTPSPTVARPPTTEPPGETAPTRAATPQAETRFIDQLPSPPDSWVEDLVLAWVDETELLQLREMTTGAVLPAKQLADNILPPLPEHIQLLGAENATWMIDLQEPSRSGKLSNSVRMVRLGENLDSYGFISRTEDRNRFFVGSLWGPAMNGTAETPASSTVIPVQRTGIVVSTQAAESSLVVGGGMERLPSRLGRVVVASETRLAGIHCDDLGRCIGRVTDWDGSDEVEIPAASLARPVVRLSPAGTYVVGVESSDEPGTSSWIAHDLATGSSRSWELPVAVDESLVWSPRSDVVFWIHEGVLVALSIAEVGRPVAQVRQVGVIGSRLAGSELVALEGPAA